MARKPESLFQDKVLADLRALPHTFAEKIQQKTICGTPDIIACIRGIFVALELKSEKGRPDPLQGYVLEQIREAGGIAKVVWPKQWPELLEKLRELSSTGDAYFLR